MTRFGVICSLFYFRYFFFTSFLQCCRCAQSYWIIDGPDVIFYSSSNHDYNDKYYTYRGAYIIIFIIITTTTTIQIQLTILSVAVIDHSKKYNLSYKNESFIEFSTDHYPVSFHRRRIFVFDILTHLTVEKNLDDGNIEVYIILL